MSETKNILVLNAGSSSLRFAVFDESPARVLSGKFDRIGLPKSVFMTQTERAEVPVANHVAALEHLLNRLAGMKFCAVGHRVVHGGATYRKPQRVDAAMLSELRRLSVFDPEHLPAAIALMERLAEKSPGILQIGCFDTAFHSAMPRV